MICRSTISFYTILGRKVEAFRFSFLLHFDNAKRLYLSKLNFILSWIILTLYCIRSNTVFEYWIPFITGILFIQNLSLLMWETSHAFNVWHLMLVSYRSREDYAMLNPCTCSKCEISLASTDTPGTVQPSCTGKHVWEVTLSCVIHQLLTCAPPGHLMSKDTGLLDTAYVEKNNTCHWSVRTRYSMTKLE